MNQEDMKNINRILREIGAAEAERQAAAKYESLQRLRRTTRMGHVGGALPAANCPSYRLHRRIGERTC